MKTILRNLLAVLAIVGWASSAPAAVLFTETFSYPNGGLKSRSGGLWTNYTSDGNYSVSVISEKIRVLHSNSIGPGAGSSAEDLEREFSALAAGQTVYAGFDVSALNGSISPVFAHFPSWPTSTGLSVTPFTGSDFTFGLANVDYSPTVNWPSGLTFGTTYRVVLSYEFDTGVSKLWVDPVTQSSTNISFAGAASMTVSSIGVRQHRAGGPLCGYLDCSFQLLDNLVVGTRFRDVLAIPPPMLPGDYDGSGEVNDADYAEWQMNFGSNNPDVDGNGNGIVEAADYIVWRNNIGATLGSGSPPPGIAAGVPEPASMVLAAIGLALIRLVNRRRTVGCSLGRARIVL